MKRVRIADAARDLVRDHGPDVSFETVESIEGPSGGRPLSVWQAIKEIRREQRKGEEQ